MRFFKIDDTIPDFLISKSGRFLAIWSGNQSDVFLYDVWNGALLVSYKDCDAACFMENYLIVSTTENELDKAQIVVFDCVRAIKTQSWYNEAIIISFHHHRDTVLGFADIFVMVMKLEANSGMVTVTTRVDQQLSVRRILNVRTILGIYGDYLVYQSYHNNSEKCLVFYNLETEAFEKPTLPNTFRLDRGVVGILVKEGEYNRASTLSDYLESPNETFLLMFHPERKRHQIFMQQRHRWLYTETHVRRIEATDSLLFYSTNDGVTVMDLDSIL